MIVSAREFSLIFLTLQASADAAGAAGDEDTIELPVYLNHSRSDFLFKLKLAGPAGVDRSVWSQRGTALVAWDAAAAN